jgi:hypothetical protein
VCLVADYSPIGQHRLLSGVARLVDAGTLRTTLGDVLGPINAANLRRAHRLLEEGRAIGKLVLSGFLMSEEGIGGAVTPTAPLCKQGNTWPLRTAWRRVAC